MDVKEAKKNCEAYIYAIDTFGTIDYKCINNLYEPVKVVLSELEKKDLIINEMASTMVGNVYSDSENLEAVFNNKEEAIDYFTKKAEGK